MSEAIAELSVQSPIHYSGLQADRLPRWAQVRDADSKAPANAVL